MDDIHPHASLICEFLIKNLQVVVKKTANCSKFMPKREWPVTSITLVHHPGIVGVSYNVYLMASGVTGRSPYCDRIRWEDPEFFEKLLDHISNSKWVQSNYQDHGNNGVKSGYHES